jgi:hypothetical protein
MKVRIGFTLGSSPWKEGPFGAWSHGCPSEHLLHVTALHQLNLYQKLLWVLGFLAGFLCLLLGLGAYHTWRWVQSWVGTGIP